MSVPMKSWVYACCEGIRVSDFCTRLFSLLVQSVPEKMRLEVVVEIEIEILDGHHRSLSKRFI